MKYNAKKPKDRKDTKMNEEELSQASGGFKMRSFTTPTRKEVRGSMPDFQPSGLLKGELQQPTLLVSGPMKFGSGT